MMAIALCCLARGSGSCPQLLLRATCLATAAAAAAAARSHPLLPPPMMGMMGLMMVRVMEGVCRGQRDCVSWTHFTTEKQYSFMTTLNTASWSA